MAEIKLSQKGQKAYNELVNLDKKIEADKETRKKLMAIIKGEFGDFVEGNKLVSSNGKRVVAHWKVTEEHEELDVAKFKQEDPEKYKQIFKKYKKTVSATHRFEFVA